jgi:ABC-type Zn uptake system ZnuABC Zn-binding protein ZnuA
VRRPGRRSIAGALAAVVFTAGALAGVALLAATTGGCGEDADRATGDALEVTATASFLADIAQNVAGERFTVAALVPRGGDLHGYEPTPRDLAAVAGSDLLILNGSGLEQTLEDALRGVGGDVRVVAASEGLTPRTPQPGEPLHEEHDGAEGDGASAEGSASHEVDPHFWLDPTLVKTYVANIRDAFAAADPDGAAVYEANAAAYVAELDGLDRWIRDLVAAVPVADRKLVMNHVSHGYFADRYGFTIVGAVVPSVTSGATPSARELADLARVIRESGVKAIFVDLGENPELAEQLAAETGVVVVDDLRPHTLSEPGGDAPTYIDMMKHDARRIIEALR